MTTLPRETVLVLGASRGLGQAVALALSDAGFNVGVGCRRLSDAEAVTRLVRAKGGEALPLAVDVIDHAQVVAAVATAAEWSGPLIGTVNNAGVIEPIGRIADTDAATWARLITVNLVGAFNGVHAVLPRLAPGGAIVNISSGAASNPMEGWSAYCASKAGLAMLTRSIHHEYGDRVRAYGFRPGVVDTGMQAEIRASKLNPVSQIPQSNLLKPEIPAAAVAWLLRHRPADLSGQELDIRDEDFQRRTGLAQLKK